MIRPIFRIPRVYRGFSTHANSSPPIPATLHLKTGQSFTGRSFGTPRSIYGETVFSTSITSCETFII
jgi:carbamoyl-phosphate synthase small subunit